MDHRLWMSIIELIQFTGAIVLFGWLIRRSSAPGIRERWRRRHSLFMQRRRNSPNTDGDAS